MGVGKGRLANMPQRDREAIGPLGEVEAGFCPSCCSQRMANAAARLVDDVLPRVPVRQWVLSFPYEMRCRLAYDGEWIS